MKKMGKIGFSILVCLLLTVAIFHFSEKRAQASAVILPEDFYFLFNGQKKDTDPHYEMTLPAIELGVTSGIGVPDTAVEWVSSEPGVVDIETSTHGTNYIKLVRKGPGYSTISATFQKGSTPQYMEFILKVGLEIDFIKSGFDYATTVNDRILVLDDKGQKKQVYLKYVDYDTEGSNPESVSGDAISGPAIVWESDNPGVATPSAFGLVMAAGGGSTNIKIVSKTMSSQVRPLETSFKVVVEPKFKLTYDVGVITMEAKSVNGRVSTVTADEVPSDFVIESNATLAENLKWEVRCNGKKIPATDSPLLSYTVSPLSGNVSFDNVKAGTYEIYAFADEDYITATNAPFAYMKVIVPIDIGDKNIVMSVNDTYSLLDNTNIPDAKIFSYSLEDGSSYTTADLNQTTGIITAKKSGNLKLKLDYQTDTGLYNADIDDIFINITVIDGIALSATSATIYNKGTLLLHATTTDSIMPKWSSSDTNIATVLDGLVTAKNPGPVTITVTQTVKGVVKKATCKIIVQPSVSNITIKPAEWSLSIGSFLTLKATITPLDLDLSGVTLQWRSSNVDIVTVDSNGLTATIEGIAGGHAVISAINQDNIVVGFCDVIVQQPVASIALSEKEVTLDMTAKRVQIRATVSPGNATNKGITWSTTDTTKATVDANGLITLLKPGTVTIIATSDDNPQATAMCNLNIQIPIVSIVLDETVKTMYSGQSDRLSYLILPTNASNNLVTWTSTNASIVAVDATGKVSAKGVGTAVIILKTLDGGYSVYCTITVKRVATGIKFDVSELELKTGQTYNIKPTLTPNDSTDNALAWESSNTKIAVVDDNGKVTAKAAGKVIIMARTEAGGITYCNVTVRQAVEGILLNFSEKTIFLGNEFKLKVSVSPSEASDLGVTWKSSNPKVATISEDGLIEALVGGVTVITCTTLDGGYSATCVITVRESMSKITLNYESYKIGIGKTAMLIATVTTETATDQNVTWKSSNEDVVSVTKKGKITGVSMGYATIIATAQDGSEVEASCDVRVVTPVTSVTIDKSYLNMLIGETKTLKATIQPSKATYKKAKWTSSDETVAIVDDDGSITALKEGSSTITAEARDNSGKKAICFVSVRDRVPATGITLMDKKLVMVSGEEKVVKIVLNPTTSTDGFSWSTDNSSVAKVDKNTGKITAKATGTAYVTAMTDSGKTAGIEITVIGLNVTELTLEQYTKYRLTVDGASTNISWDISNPEIAVVTGGTVSSKAIGTATVTAIVNGRKLECKLKVTKIK